MNRAEFVELDKEQKEKEEMIRNMFHNLYEEVEKICQVSRETSLGLTKLEEAQFWLIKGISREVK